MDHIAPDWRAIGTPATGASTPAPRARTLDRVPTWLIGGVALLLGLVAALVGVGAVLLLPQGGPPPSVTGVAPAGLGLSIVDAPDLVAPSARPTAALTVVVDVEGAVVSPGLVEVPAGGRVGDAIALAGGFAPRADLDAASRLLNLAEVVQDGAKIQVPAIGDAAAADTTGDSTTTTPGAGSTSQGGLVDLNHASQAELDALPGVGPATIAKILAARAEQPFGAPEELHTRGIVGDATWQKLESLVTAGR